MKSKRFTKNMDSHRRDSEILGITMSDSKPWEGATIWHKACLRTLQATPEHTCVTIFLHINSSKKECVYIKTKEPIEIFKGH